jgi:hypothetical protein
MGINRHSQPVYSRVKVEPEEFFLYLAAVRSRQEFLFQVVADQKARYSPGWALLRTADERFRREVAVHQSLALSNTREEIDQLERAVRRELGH